MSYTALFEGKSMGRWKKMFGHGNVVPLIEEQQHDKDSEPQEYLTWRYVYEVMPKMWASSIKMTECLACFRSY